MVTFKPLSISERYQLTEALRGNTNKDKAILMNPRDTTFAGSGDMERQSGEITDNEVMDAIKSVPCHYGAKR